MTEKNIHVGKVSGVFGVKGWIKVFSYTEPKQNICSYTPWIIEKGASKKEVVVLDSGLQGKAIVAKLADVNDRDQALLLNGYDIYIKAEQLPPTEDDEYYWSDLVGMQVQTDTGKNLGEVDYLIRTGANDVLVVQGDRERLIPFLQGSTILSIDLDDGLMVVDWDPDF